MRCYRFHMIGGQPLELEVDVATIAELGEALSRRRFIEGRMTQPDDDGVLAGVLIATSRIQCVIETG